MRRAEALRRRLSGARIVAVGEATAQALRAAGLAARRSSPAARPGGARGAARPAGRQRGSCLPCGEDASVALSDALRRRGARVERVASSTARSRGRPIRGSPRRDRRAAGTAPSARRRRRRRAGSSRRGPRRRPSGCARLRPSSLGPSTRRLLDRYGVERIVAAPRAAVRGRSGDCSRSLPRPRPGNRLASRWRGFPEVRLRRLRRTPALRGRSCARRASAAEQLRRAASSSDRAGACASRSPRCPASIALSPDEAVGRGAAAARRSACRP